MEEKERYEWNSPYDSAVRDNKNDDIINAIERLNEQDKRIKELEEEYQDLKEDNDATTESLYASRTYLDKNTSKMWGLEKENQQLKQQLHDLPKKIVEDIEKNFTEYLPLKDKTGAGFYSRLNTILKKYGGEDE